MQAVIQHGYGGPETFELVDVPMPTPGTGEVLIRVRAAAIDRGTWHLMTGLPLLVRPFFGLQTPRQPIVGRDVAGVVEHAQRVPVERGPALLGERVSRSCEVGSQCLHVPCPVVGLAERVDQQFDLHAADRRRVVIDQFDVGIDFRLRMLQWRLLCSGGNV